MTYLDPIWVSTQIFTRLQCDEIGLPSHLKAQLGGVCTQAHSGYWHH